MRRALAPQRRRRKPQAKKKLKFKPYIHLDRDGDVLRVSAVLKAGPLSDALEVIAQKLAGAMGVSYSGVASVPMPAAASFAAGARVGMATVASVMPSLSPDDVGDS